MKEELYRSVVKEAPVCYACHKIIYDKNGKASDLEYVDANPSFLEFVGLTEDELIGSYFSAIFPNAVNSKLELLKIYEKVFLSGSTAIKKSDEKKKDVFRIKYYSPEKDYLAVYVSGPLNGEALNVTEELPEDSSGATRRNEVPGALWQKRLNEIVDVLKLEDDLQFKRIIENLPFSLDILTLDGTVLYANPKCLKLFEFEESLIGTKNIKDHWVDVRERKAWVDALKQRGIINDFEMHLKSASGKEFWVLASGIIIQYRNQPCILSTQLDITERKRIESALIESEEKYRLLTEFTSDVIWIYNLSQRKYSYVSPSIYYLIGYTAEEAINMGMEDILTRESMKAANEAIARDFKEFSANPNSQKAYIIEVRHNCKNGDVIWVEISSKFRSNAAGEIEIVGASRNIEERKKAEREVVYLSYHDHLTGLFNRRYYEEELERMNCRSNLPITLVIADVNGLKLTNDVFGHFAGDDLLKKFTAVLNEVKRPEDVAARIGGDEFILLLPKTDSAEAEKLIARMKALMRCNKPVDAILSVSFGWAAKDSVSEDFNSLFIQAEDHMYHSKLIESSKMKDETIKLAMRKLYERNADEKRHSERVGMLCRKIGLAMDQGENFLRELELLGRMHDIGKIGIPSEILNKAGRLNETEWLEMKRHPEIGYQILRSADEYVHIAEAVLSHHERMDGGGYPRNLKAHQIPLAARILSIAEAYDVMVGDDFGQDANRKSSAVCELTAKSGTQFDEELVKLFIKKVLG